MFCRKCGVELRAGAMFCHKCGHPAPVPDGRAPRPTERSYTAGSMASTGAVRSAGSAASSGTPWPSSSAAPSSEAHHAPGLINTMPKQEERSSGGQFEEWFSDAGDL